MGGGVLRASRTCILEMLFFYWLDPFRVTDWDGVPIDFGGLITYVCKRGYKFEEDPLQENVQYECQDGTKSGSSRGFFNIPKVDEQWPNCVEGTYNHCFLPFILKHNYFLLKVSGLNWGPKLCIYLYYIRVCFLSICPCLSVHVANNKRGDWDSRVS